MHIFFLGYPGHMGGANTECWHTATLWRSAAIDVTFIPTWGCDPFWEEKLASIGCKTVHAGTADRLAGVPDFPGSVVVAMCNSHAMNARGALKDLGCRLVWLNCMTFLFQTEIAAFRRYGAAEAYVFQSEYQRTELEKILPAFGYVPAMGRVIRGALGLDEVPYGPRPHRPREEFYVGKLARPDGDKWSSNHWRILQRVPYAARRALVMGWTLPLARKCGQPPAWAETFAPQQLAAGDFLARCHALLGLNGGARENWPRVGLEAMAGGVPLVCQNLWGWREMIVDGETGFLTDSDEEMAFRLAQLAYDEPLRQKVVRSARAHVERLAEPKRLAEQWKELFECLEQGSFAIPQNHASPHHRRAERLEVP